MKQTIFKQVMDALSKIALKYKILHKFDPQKSCFMLLIETGNNFSRAGYQQKKEILHEDQPKRNAFYKR